MRYAIFEILEMCAKERGKNKKAIALQGHSSKQLKTILDYTFNPNITWLINPEDIEYTPCDDNLNTLRTRLFTEASKLNRFVNFGPYVNLNYKKRLDLFRTVLETIHPEDAKMLVHIVKYRKLPWNLDDKAVKIAFPNGFTKTWVKNDNNEDTGS